MAEAMPSLSDSELERRAREGKREFIVEVVDTTTYRAWATDAAKAEDAVYWRRSSGRPTPDVEDVSASTRTIRVR